MKLQSHRGRGLVLPVRRRWPLLRPWQRLLVAAAMALAVFTVGGFIGAPLVVRPLIEDQLGQSLGRRVTIERVRINPFALSLTVEGFQILERDGHTPFLSCRRLYVNAELASVYRRAPVVREIWLESPSVRVERRMAPAGTWTAGAIYNFSDILGRWLAAPRAPKPAGEVPPRFSLNNIRVTGGALTFDDQPLRVRHEITEFTLGLPFVSTLPLDVDTFVAPGLSGRVNGTPFAIKARSKPFKDTRETFVELRLDTLDLTRYLPYLPVRLPAVVSSALATVALDVAFLRPEQQVPRLSVKGELALWNVVVRESLADPRLLVGLDRLAVNGLEADLATWRFAVDQVLVSGLDVRLRRRADSRLNVTGLAGSGGPAAGRFSVGKLRIDRSSLHLRDESTRPAFEANVQDISVSIDGLSNAPHTSASVEVALRAHPGGKLAHRGRLTLDPLAASGTIALEGLEPGRFAPYYRDRLALEVVKGRLNIRTHFELTRRAGADVRLRGAEAQVQDLVVRRPGERSELLRLAELALHGADVDLGRRVVSVAQIRSRQGYMRVTRDRRAASGTPALAPPAPGWAASVGRLNLEGWEGRVEDRSVSPPALVAIQSLSLQASSLSTAPGSRGKIDLRFGLNRRGRVGVIGTVGLDPPVADCWLDLRSVELVPLQPYFRDQVNLSATSGLVWFRGQARVELTPGGTSVVQTAPRLRLTGDGDVKDLGLVDRVRREPLLRWRSFHVGGLRMSTPPLRVAARQVALSDFGVRLTKDQNAQFNVATAVRRSDPVATGGTRPATVSVGQVKLERGEIRFSDRTIQPNYSVQLTEVGGSLTNLSSSAAAPAELDLSARLNHTGRLAIAGKVNQLGKDLFLDIRGDAKNIDLPPASGYAVKYLGYGIRKGKLSLAADYHVARRQIQAHNKVTLDRFTLGEKVASPGATKLPVRLAVALLKDRHGIIELDLPLSGSLNDPHLDIWGQVGKGLGNVVTNAATAPFSLIARVFGGGDQLSSVGFPPGLVTLDDAARVKLASLARALGERGDLSLDLQGGVDPGIDREGLRRYLFERTLKLAKRAELVARGEAVRDANELNLDRQDRARLLAAAYRAATFAKPRNILGLPKRLPPDEMEKLMLANLEVTESNLRTLAQRRALVVKESLARLTPEAAGRLFLVSPRMSGGASVDFNLRAD